MCVRVYAVTDEEAVIFKQYDFRKDSPSKATFHQVTLNPRPQTPEPNPADPGNGEGEHADPQDGNNNDDPTPEPEPEPEPEDPPATGIPGVYRFNDQQSL